MQLVTHTLFSVSRATFRRRPKGRGRRRNEPKREVSSIFAYTDEEKNRFPCSLVVDRPFWRSSGDSERSGRKDRSVFYTRRELAVVVETTTPDTDIVVFYVQLKLSRLKILFTRIPRQILRDFSFLRTTVREALGITRGSMRWQMRRIRW